MLITKANCWGLAIIVLLAVSVFAALPINAATNPEQSNQTLTHYDNLASSSELMVTASALSSDELAELMSTMGVYHEGTNYNRIIDGHGTGLIPPTKEEWNDLAQTLSVVDTLTYTDNLSSSVDWSATSWFPPIGDQMHQGSCAAWAVGYYIKTFQEAKEHNWNFSEATWNETQPASAYQDLIISPAFIYNLLNGGVDEGLNFEEPIQLVCSVGAASWQKMPYNDQDCTTWPSEAAWTQAAYYRGDSAGYAFIDVDTNEGLTNLKNLLASGNLAVTAVDAYKFKNFTDNDVLVVDKYVDLELNHAATIVGYDDDLTYVENGQIVHGAFKVANSWGIDQLHANMTHWENVLDGCYWISYETMKQQVGWVMYYNNCVDYQPSLLATFQVDHPIRGEVSITVGMGTPDAPIATKIFSEYKTYSDTTTGYVFGGNHSFCPNKIVLDISEFLNYPLNPYGQGFFLRVHDSGTSAVGNVTYFAIGDSTCVTTPVETKQFEYVYLTVNHSLVLPALTIVPTSGQFQKTVTLTGVGFNTGSSVNLSYLNPVTSTWTSIVSDLPVPSSSNFTYEFAIPDLRSDTVTALPLFSRLVFKAQDTVYGYSCNATVFCIQWRHGLLQLSNV